MHPSEQGQGRGSALLQHHHGHLDNAEIAAYLEATIQDAKQLYERHGYEGVALSSAATGERFAPHSPHLTWWAAGWFLPELCRAFGRHLWDGGEVNACSTTWSP